MIGRTNVGGGAELNFKIVGGTTQPSNPKENTIWVNTATEITGWVFSKEEPSGANGVVWFNTGDTYLATVEALKKNSVILRISAVEQYVNDAWVRKEWSIYQNGAWSAFGARLYLYDNGDHCIDVSGGWTRYTYGSNLGTITYGDEYITFPGTDVTALIRPKAFDGTRIKNYTKLMAEVEVVEITSSSNPYFTVGLVKNYTFSSDIGSQWLEKASATTVGTHTLSVSIDAYESGNIMLGAFHLEAKLKAVWLE